MTAPSGLSLPEVAKVPAASEGTSLRMKMVTGFKWSFTATLIQGVLQIGVTMTMARLLAPAEYGLYAMVEVVVRWAALFGQTGLVTVLVQKPAVTETDLRAGRTLALGMAVGLAVLIAAGAPLIAAGFGNPAVVPLLRAASLSFLFNGIGLTSIAMLRRRMQFGRLSAAELSGYLIGNGLTAIVLARNGAGVWSVVVGSLVGQCVQNAVAIAQAKLASGFSFQRSSLGALVREGSHVSVNSCLDVVNNTMDTFVVARVMPAAVLGMFNRATMLATLPTHFLWTAISRVTFASYAKLQLEPRAFAEFFHRTQRWTGTLSVAVPLGMIPAADVIVHFLLGPNWSAAVPVFRLLLVAFTFESLAFPYHSALDALGAYGDRTRIRIFSLLVRGCSLALLVAANPNWVFITGSLAALCTWLSSLQPFARRIGGDARVFLTSDLAILGRGLLCGLMVAVERVLVGFFQLPVYLELLGCVAAGAGTLFLILRRPIAALNHSG